MALRFCDSFDHYNTAHIDSKWTFFPSQSADVSINTSSARNGGQCAAVTRVGVAKTVDNISTWIVGGAFMWATYGGGVKLIDDSIAEVSWSIQPDGTIKVFDPSGNTLGQTNPTDAIALNKYYYVEMKTVLHSSAGTVEMRINGQTVLTLSGKNTSTTNNADVVNLTGPSGGALVYVDDFYVCDGSGGTNNTFLGDVQIGILKPRAEGNKLEWVTNTGTVHFSLVNEIPPDDDTTYVSSTMTGSLTSGTGSGPSDLYLFDTIGTNRVVLGVQTNIFARKDDEGNRAISVLTSNAGTITQADPSGRFMNLTYIDYLNQFDTNPVGGGSWTPTVMNTMQWGVEVVS